MFFCLVLISVILALQNDFGSTTKCTSAAVPCQFCTFSRQGNPACKFSHAWLDLYLLWIWEPHTHVQPSGCMQQCPAVFARFSLQMAPFYSCWSSLERDGWGSATAALQVGQDFHTLSNAGKQTGAHWFLQPSLCGLSYLFCRSCAIGPQLTLRRNCSKCRRS